MGRVSFAENVEGQASDDLPEEPVNIYEYQNTPENKSWAGALPLKQGLYDPELEKDACGVGFAAHIKGQASHKIITDGKSLPTTSSLPFLANVPNASCLQRETSSVT